MFDKEGVEARLALELIASADMPSLAWDALEAGLDGPGIRRLAALERPTYFEVAEVLPRALNEMGLKSITPVEGAVRIAKRIAEDILRSGDDPLKHLRDFEALWIRSGYPLDLAGLGSMYDDAWVAQSCGQSESQIRESVVSLLRQFVAEHSAV